MDALVEGVEVPEAGEADPLEAEGWVGAVEQGSEPFFSVLRFSGFECGEHFGLGGGALEDEGEIVITGDGGEGLEPNDFHFGVAGMKDGLLAHDGASLR